MGGWGALGGSLYQVDVVLPLTGGELIQWFGSRDVFKKFRVVAKLV